MKSIFSFPARKRDCVPFPDTLLGAALVPGKGDVFEGDPSGDESEGEVYGVGDTEGAADEAVEEVAEGGVLVIVEVRRSTPYKYGRCSSCSHRARSGHTQNLHRSIDLSPRSMSRRRLEDSSRYRSSRIPLRSSPQGNM